jgi:membrane protease YdiL (CAAX protease family)
MVCYPIVHSNIIYYSLGETNMNNKFKIWWYVGIVFIISYAWQYLIYKTGEIESLLIPFLMLIPGIIAIVFIIIKKEGFRKVGWGLKKWWYIFPAIFIPLTVAILIVLLMEALHWATFVGKLFTFKNGMVEISNIKLILGNQAQNISFFIFNFLLSHTIFLTIGSIITLGEELGWRGYLQEKMLRKFGLNKGLIFLGIIWGYWHLPIILMGFNFPDNPILGALLLMPLGTIFLAIFMGWLYLRSRSIWIPALAHASANLFSQLIFSFMTMHQNELFRQLIWIATWGIIAILCLINLNRNKPIFWQETNATTDNNNEKNT